MTFLEALKTRRPMRRASDGRWIELDDGRWRVHAGTMGVLLDRDDYLATDWEVMP